MGSYTIKFIATGHAGTSPFTKKNTLYAWCIVFHQEEAAHSVADHTSRTCMQGISCLLSCFTLVQRKQPEIQTLHLNVFGCIIIIESVIVLPYLSRCIRFVVFMCVCVCSDVLKNCTVPFAQHIHMHKGVWTITRT